jgi:hypothetical protein
MTIYRPAILRLLIFAITFLVFARLTTCEFTWWDDQDTIHQNPRLNPPTLQTLGFYWTTAGEQTTMGLYVPVTYMLWSGLAKINTLDRVDANGTSLNAHVFHTANVLIHALTAVLVFSLLLRLFGNDIAAALGALLFALHPVQVESVGWISGTKDLLCGFFSVAALLMYVRSVQVRQPIPASRSPGHREHTDLAPSDPVVRDGLDAGLGVLECEATHLPHKHWPLRWQYFLGLLFFIFGMLSKPTAVVVPLMAATIGIVLLHRPIKKTLAELMFWFVFMIPCLIWTKLVQPARWESGLPLWTRPIVAVDAVAFYLYKLVWPIHLCIDYGHTPQAIVQNHFIYFSWILPAAVVGLLWWKSSRCRPAIAAGLLFLMPLLPVLGFVGFEFQQISTTSDHYLYLPMLGVAALATWWLGKRQSWKKIMAAIAILIALSIRCILQEPTWQDTRSLFYHALAVNPNSVVSSDGLGFLTGREAREMTDPSKARLLFDQSIAWYERSLRGDPTSVPSLFNLALDYKAIGQIDRGRQLTHRIVELQPQLPQGLRVEPILLARRLHDFPDLPDTISWLDEVIRRDPGNQKAIYLREQAIQAAEHKRTK